MNSFIRVRSLPLLAAALFWAQGFAGDFPLIGPAVEEPVPNSPTPWLRCAEGQEEPPPAAPAPVKPAISARMRMNPPAAPKPGEPINDLSLAAYMEREGERLVLDGVTLTNWPGLKVKKSAQLKLPRAGSRPKDPTAVVSRMEQAVAVVGVLYHCDRCTRLHLMSATGFFISQDGALATCWHVLGSTGDKAKGVVVMTRAGRVLPVKGILASDEFNDLVVLQVGLASGESKGKQPLFTPLPLASSVSVGSSVSILSHPERHFYLYTRGVVAREIAERRGNGLLEQLCVTAEFAKGSSGAPVVDETGAVIGIVNNTQSIYYTVTREDQRDFQMTIRNCTPGRVLQRLCAPASGRS